MRPLRLVLSGSLAAGLLLSDSACASMKSPPVETTPDTRPEPTFVTDGPGCADARQRALRTPTLKDIYPPVPRVPFVPPASAFPLNGAILIMTVRVDTAGRAMSSTGRVTRNDNGVIVPGYKTDVTDALEKHTFRPAVLSGCAVEGVATLTYNTRR